MYALNSDLCGMELKSKIKPDGSNVVDVRTKMEFMMGHVKGSTNIPLDTVPHELEKLKGFGQPLILCCASGGRSGQATEFLKANGFEDVHNGGGWREVKEVMDA